MTRMAREADHVITLDVNGRTRSSRTEAHRLLSDFLRHELGLTGTHVGCEHGVCGACTVLIDGKSCRSCLTLAVQVDGCRVDTVESLATSDTAAFGDVNDNRDTRSASDFSVSSDASDENREHHPNASHGANVVVSDTTGCELVDTRVNDLQLAFARHDALQCGFCTAGILMSCSEFLAQHTDPDEWQVRDMLSGHLCRCTGYTGMVNAVLDVAGQRRRGRRPQKTRASGDANTRPTEDTRDV